MKLARTLEQWRCCDPVSMSCMSPAAVQFALTDARADILALATALRQVIDKHDAWAKQMPAGAFDDPLADAINGARALLP